MPDSQNQTHNYCSYLNTQYGIHTTHPPQLAPIEQPKWWENKAQYQQPISRHVRQSGIKESTPTDDHNVPFNGLEKGAPTLRQQEDLYQYPSPTFSESVYDSSYSKRPHHLCTIDAINGPAFENSKKQKGKIITYLHAYI